MYLSLNWVKNWLKLPKEVDNRTLALDLTMSTVEVEKVIDQADNLSGIVIGKIEEITKHPQADKLQVCQVNVGDDVKQIVCGGNNVSKGMKVAVAKVGAKVRWHGEGELATLEKAKIRGIASDGMIVSANEIDLAEVFPHDEREILDLSDFKVKVGQPLSEALGLNDTIFDIDNKSINHRPDLWGQYGLARELAAIYKVKLKEFQVAELKTGNQTKLSVNVADRENCYRYIGLAIRNIKVTDSPWWLKKALQSVGIRPINNIVDVSNYVMYELGQPLHAFDARQISENSIIVKQAAKGDKFITLDGEKRKLPEGALMIADGEKYVALAGIMGGQNSEIAADTTEIILESANFKAANIRRTSMALGLRTESSARFEKSLDPVLAETAIRRAANIILALCPDAQLSSKMMDVNNNPFKEISLSVPEAMIDDKLGQVIPTAEKKDILKRLKFDFSYRAKTFAIKVPSWRATKDISIAEDIVEEVSRIYGYDNVEAKLPSITLYQPKSDVSHNVAKNIKGWLTWGQGYNEIYSYPFTDINIAKALGMKMEAHIKVKNAVSPEQSYLNLSLLPNIIKKGEENLRWFEEFKIFELQRVFDKNTKGIYAKHGSQQSYLPHQPKQMVGVEMTKQSAENLFLSVKGLIEAMMKHFNVAWNAEQINLEYSDLAYSIKHQDIVLGQFGLLDDDVWDSGTQNVRMAFWQVDFSVLAKYVNKLKLFQGLYKFPSVKRDIAIIVDRSVKWEDIRVESTKISPLIRSIEPFDVFLGKSIGADKKSIAFHVEFRSENKTLQADDVDKMMLEIQLILEKKFQAILR